MSKAVRTVLVLGATGGIGGETANAFARRGWKVRALARREQPAKATAAWEWVKGDAMDKASIVARGKSARI